MRRNDRNTLADACYYSAADTGSQIAQVARSKPIDDKTFAGRSSNSGEDVVSLCVIDITRTSTCYGWKGEEFHVQCKGDYRDAEWRGCDWGLESSLILPFWRSTTELLQKATMWGLAAHQMLVLSPALVQSEAHRIERLRQVLLKALRDSGRLRSSSIPHFLVKLPTKGRLVHLVLNSAGHQARRRVDPSRNSRSDH